MKKHLSIIIVGLFYLFFHNLCIAQSQLTDDARAYAKKQTKKYEKENWQTQPGPTMYEMFEEEYLLRKELIISGTGTYSRYLYQNGISTSQVLSVAKRQAEVQAREDLLTAVRSSLSGIISTQLSNAQLSINQATAVSQIQTRFETMTSGDLVNTKTVISVYREKANVVEYSVMVFIDLQQAAKDLIEQHIQTNYIQDPSFVVNEIKKLNESEYPQKK